MKNIDEKLKSIIKKLTDKFEQFLKACKAEGDTTIDDVLKRLEELRKET